MNHITIHTDVEQGSDEWHEMRCGILTASEVKNIITPKTLKLSKGGEVSHLYELLAQRITGYVEPQYISDDMLRGHVDEIEARELYAEHFAPVDQVGFITNNKWGFTIGYSPDGLVGDDGLIEVKSRRQKLQIEHLATGEIPTEAMLQMQTGMLVSGRKWCDYISYCGGTPMKPQRVYADEAMQTAIVEAASQFETVLAQKLSAYEAALEDGQWIGTERKEEKEMFI